MPSGRSLCRALAQFAQATSQPRRLLEVGPGTGAATEWMLRRMGSADQLDLVELNDRFVARLRDRLEQEPLWQAAADRVRVIHAPIEELAANRRYHAIVSGLPLNNFSGEAVRSILRRLQRLAEPGGTLSMFEYIGIRRAKSLVAGREERRRLLSVESALRTAIDAHACGRRCIIANVPPAWVHHLQFIGDEAPLFSEDASIPVGACPATAQAT